MPVTKTPVLQMNNLDPHLFSTGPKLSAHTKPPILDGMIALNFDYHREIVIIGDGKVRHRTTAMKRQQSIGHRLALDTYFFIIYKTNVTP
jgi:hypothetical protein